MKKKPARAFTLVEMLAVLGIIAMLTAVSLPALNSISQQTGRKAAISQLLGIFEQARTAALESGRDTHVVFLTDSTPALSQEERYRGFAVYQDPDSSGSGTVVPLSKWMFLPKGISFMGSVPTQTVFGANRLPITQGPYKSAVGFPVVTFTPTGNVSAPSSPMLNIYLFEGFTAADGTPTYTSRNNAYFDKISISKFTGRAQLQISKPPDATNP